MVANFLNVLQKERVFTDLDTVSWRGETGSRFSVCEASKVLHSTLVSLFLVKGIWLSFVLTKVSFFSWEAAWGKVLTLDKLQRRELHLPNRFFCVAVLNRPSTTFYYIARLSAPFGRLFYLLLASLVSSRRWLRML